MPKKLTLMLICAIVLCGSAPALADTFTLAALPADISGPAGSTLGWGYTITNNSSTLWLMTLDVAADPFFNGTPDASVFDYPVVAPDSSVTVNYDGVTGLFALTWDPAAPGGTMDAGAFSVSADWYTDDPSNGGTWVQSADPASAVYSATVSATVATVPEPATFVLLLSGLAGCLLKKRRL